MSTKKHQVSRATYHEKGFTLIELLIVVTIIAILVSIGSVSFLKAQSQGRDAQRLGDLGDIQSALEQYYADTLVYPPSNGDWLSSAGGDPPPWIPEIERYISEGVPREENDSASYRYFYASANGGTTYLLTAGLENNKSDLPESPQGTFDIGVPFSGDCNDLYTIDTTDCVIYSGPVTD